MPRDAAPTRDETGLLNQRAQIIAASSRSAISIV
jgi:hypothetical protein